MASSNTAGLLEINPTDLKFRFELKKQIPSTLQLINHGDQPVAFKVKTTSPKKYCVRPNTGIVGPHGTTEVQVIMQSQREQPTDLHNSKDKFLVQSTVVTDAVTNSEVTSDTFAKRPGREIHEAKLRVIYIAPAPPPSPVLEGNEGDEKAHAADAVNGVAMTSGQRAAEPERAKYENAMANLAQVTNEKNAAAAERERLQNELNLLMMRMRDMEASSKKGGGAAVGGKDVQKDSAGGGFSLLHLLLAVLFAFVLGRFT